MLLVVIGHSSLANAAEQDPEWEVTLYRLGHYFRMQLFMIVSGYLFYFTRLKSYGLKNDGSEKRWSYFDIIKDKAKRLLLPGVVFTFVAFAVKIAFPSEMARQTGFSIREIANAFLFPYDNPFREYWFIATLFWFFILTPLWKIVLKKEWLKWLMLAVLVCLHFFHPAMELLCINLVFGYAIWFYLGVILSEVNFVENFIAPRSWLVMLIGVAVFVVGLYTTSFITTLGGVLFSFALALIADKYIPKLFFTFRNYTYQIFLMGIFAQMFVKIVYRHVEMPYVCAFLLCILFGLYVPVLVSKIIERLNWRPLKLCVGLK